MLSIASVTDSQQFALIFDYAPIGVAIVRYGTILDVNNTFVSMHGYEKKEELRGHPLGKVVSEKLKEEVTLKGNERIKGKNVDSKYESIARKADETEFPILVHANRINYSGEDAVIAYVTDLTTQKVNENLFRNLFEHSPIPTVIHDFSELKHLVEKHNMDKMEDLEKYLKENPKIVDEFNKSIKREKINPAFNSLLKLQSDADFLNDRPFIFQTEHSKSSFDKSRNRIIQGEIDFSFETKLVRTDGKEISVWVKRSVDTSTLIPWKRIYTFIIDLTDFNEVQRKHFEAEKKYKSFFDFAMDGILLTRLEDLTIADYNSTLAKMFGYNETELLGASSIDLASKFQHPEMRGILSLVEMGQTVFNHREYQRKDGSTFIAQVKAKLVVIGKESFILSFLQDVTNQVESQLIITQTRQQLYQAQKMEAIGRMSGGIAHDFNNLLTLINLNAEYLELQLDPNSPLMETVSSIQETVEKATKITSELLLFSRNRVMKQEVIEITELLLKFSTSFAHLLKPPINYELVSHQMPLNVRIDPILLEQVLVNLVMNAKDALPNGGNISINVGRIPKNYMINEGKKIEHSLIQIIIKDNGEGISQEILPNIFEPFFTTKDVGKGTGLGLATSYTIIQQFGGFIHVESELHKGTTFSIYLPEHKDENIPKNELVNELHAKQLGQSIKIMVVDDDDNIRAIIKQILGNYDFEVIDFDNGNIAIKQYDNNPDGFDLILTDIQMPNILGTEVIRRIRQTNASIPVIYMTGYTRELRNLVNSLRSNEIILQKPFQADELLSSIETLLDRKIT